MPPKKQDTTDHPKITAFFKKKASSSSTDSPSKKDTNNNSQSPNVKNPSTKRKRTIVLSDSDNDEEDIKTPIKKDTTPKKETPKKEVEKKTTPKKEIKKVEKKETPKKEVKKKEDVMELSDDENDTQDIIQKSPEKKKRKSSSDKTETKKETTSSSANSGYKKRFDKGGHEQNTKAKNPGSKTVPIGKPNCLKGKSFVITGQLDSLDRTEMEDLIKEYGGLIRKSVSGRTSYVIVGDNPGESKMKKVREHNTTQISEDDVFEMLRKSNPDQQSFNNDKKVDEIKKSDVIKLTTHTIPLNTLTDSQLWVDKYAPTKTSDVIGHNKDISTLKDWLKTWFANLDKYNKENKDTKSKRKKKSEDGWKRAALLSGPPGIGKTTTAVLVAKECGFDNVIELNASDSRSKKLLQQQISESVLSTKIEDFFGSKKTKTNNLGRNTLVIMDEVDGMSSGDRGGVAELVQLIKLTKVPIICICNDRSKQNLKTLITYCLDLKFSRPNKNVVTKRLAQICHQEGLSIDSNAIEHLIESLNGDVRSVINNLQLMQRYHTGQTVTYSDAKNSNVVKTSSNDGLFEVVKEVFQPPKSFNDVLEAYHYDSLMIPSFVQQNYINIKPSNSKNDKDRLLRVSYAADSISYSDVVNTKIRKEQKFQLMNTHAFYSVAYPSYFVRGNFQPLRGYDRYYQFPSSLSKGSTIRKNYKLLRGLQQSSSLMTSANAHEMLDYLPMLSHHLLLPVIEEGKEGVDQAIEAMDEYQITRDDLEFICELTTFKGKLGEEDLFGKVDTRTKTALTKQYNKTHKGFTKVKAAAALRDDASDESEDGSEDEDENKSVEKFISNMKKSVKLAEFEKKRERAEKKKSSGSKTGASTKKGTKTKKTESETNKKPLKLKRK
ncbi:hypothetical protein ABK040_007138 [Willaertia magna]